jgi:hypothetical protein
MIIKASGRSALILATGLLVCFAAGPSQAAPVSADNAAANAKSEAAANAKPENTAGAPVALSKYTKHASRHAKSYAHRTSGKLAEQPSPDKNTAEAAADDGDNSSASPAIPPAVANANALASADSATGNAAKAMSARANEIVQNTPDDPANAQTQVVSADQLNDVDRALHENTSPAPTLAMASAEAPAAPAAPVMAASNSENSAWDQTSLIGKIFIGFGALLTMASAARMFMA